ncbi:transposase [Streptococcus pyogenes]|nr:transposase [Streptococcus pyogenes]
MKELYQHRKETIERLFGTAKEYHNLRYTREKGKSKMEDKVGLTLACLNLKKLVKRMAGEPFYFVQMRWFKHGNSHFLSKNTKKDKHQIDVCLQSETLFKKESFFIKILLITYSSCQNPYTKVEYMK